MKFKGKAILASIITAVIVAAVTAAVTVYTTKGIETGAIPFPELQPSGVTARIINTGGAGVSYYLAPRRDSGKAGAESEGKTVRVVCQVRNGEPTTDTSGRTKDQPENWPVWNKTSDGRYFPDTWSDLPKIPGPTPPHGLRVC